MQFRFVDMPKVELPATLYTIELYFVPTDSDFKSIVNALYYAQKKNPHISWLVSLSETKGKAAVKCAEKNGKRGRPKTRVYGDKVKRHIHVCLLGNKEQSAWGVAKTIKKSVDKRMGKKVSRIVPKKGTGFITYCIKQGNQIRTGGEFDFYQCNDGFYIEA